MVHCMVGSYRLFIEELGLLAEAPNPKQKLYRKVGNKIMNFNCPGSIRIKEPMPEIFICPGCGEEVEIWTHERMRKCISCGKSVSREIDSAWCIQWCHYAKECVVSIG